MSAWSNTTGKARLARVALIALLIAAVLSGAVWLQYSIDGTSVAKASWSESSFLHTADSLLDVFGGIRETLAAYFWTKTDVVFHEYLGGDVRREEPLYPYYWLITRLDPHFVMAYYFASWMLCRFDQTEEGFELALEGLRNNPNSMIMQKNLAEIYLFFKGDTRKARYHTYKAVQLAEDEEDLEVLAIFLELIDKIESGERELPPATFEDIEGEAEHLLHEHHHE